MLLANEVLSTSGFGPAVVDRYTGAAVVTYSLANAKRGAGGFLRDPDGRLVVAPQPTYSSVVLSDNPVGYWRFAEPAGPTVVDDAANNDGTATAGVSFGVPGMLASDTALGFDGAQGKVAFGASGLSGAFSLEAWVFCTGPGSVGSATHSCILASDASHRLLLVNGTGSLLGQFGAGNVTTAAGVAELNVWNHVAYTFDGVDQAIFVNGVEVARVSSGTPTFTAAFFVGAYSEPSINYSFEGSIDQVAIYDEALPLARWAAHYEAGQAS